MNRYTEPPTQPARPLCNCGRPGCPRIVTGHANRKHATPECSLYAGARMALEKNRAARLLRPRGDGQKLEFCACGCGKKLTGNQTRWHSREHKHYGVPKTPEQVAARRQMTKPCKCGRSECNRTVPAHSNKLYADECKKYVEQRQQRAWHAAKKAGRKPEPRVTIAELATIERAKQWCYECQEIVVAKKHPCFARVEL